MGKANNLKAHLDSAIDKEVALLSQFGAMLQTGSGFDSITDWIENENIMTDMGVPFELQQHNFMRDLLNDYHPRQVQIKCAQVGLSTATILKTFYAAKYYNWNIIYTLPSGDQARKFVTKKVNPLIANNELMRGWRDADDSKSLKKVGDRFISYSGTWSHSDAIMDSSDLNVHDELDASDPKTIQTYKSRLAYSDYGGRWYFSNPTGPGVGVDRFWMLSDQRHWFVKCKACNEWQFMDWPESVCRKHQRYQCKHCRKHLSDQDRIDGEWVAKYADRSDGWHGYWISHLFAPWRSAKDVIDDYVNEDTEYFMNMVLGKTHQGSDKVVTEQSIQNCIGAEGREIGAAKFIGVDQRHSEKHYVIGDLHGVYEVGMCQHFAKEDAGSAMSIEKLIEQVQPYCVLVDALPDTLSVEKLRAKFPGRVMMSYYQQDPKDPKAFKWDDMRGVFQSARNRIIDDFMADIHERKMQFTFELGKSKVFAEYVEQLTGMFMQTTEDRYQNRRRIWTSGKPDHFVHASVYYKMARARFVQYTGADGKKRPVKYIDQLNAMPKPAQADEWMTL